MNTHSVAQLTGCRFGLAVFAAMFVVTGCATSAAKSGQPEKSTPSLSREDCIFASVLNDWSALSDDQLIIFGPGRRQAYLTTLSFPSSDLTFDIRLGFYDSDRNGRICGHGFDAIIFPGGHPDRISIASMQRIDPAEAKRLIEAAKKPRKAKAADKVPAEPAPVPAT